MQKLEGCTSMSSCYTCSHMLAGDFRDIPARPQRKEAIPVLPEASPCRDRTLLPGRQLCFHVLRLSPRSRRPKSDILFKPFILGLYPAFQYQGRHGELLSLSHQHRQRVQMSPASGHYLSSRRHRAKAAEPRRQQRAAAVPVLQDVDGEEIWMLAHDLPMWDRVLL
jgi:hypothetical protein